MNINKINKLAYRKNNIETILFKSVIRSAGLKQYTNFPFHNREKVYELLGYDNSEIVKHLESQFTDEMDWFENRHTWCISYRVPPFYFKRKGINDIRVINSLKNIIVIKSEDLAKHTSNLDYTLNNYDSIYKSLLE